MRKTIYMLGQTTINIETAEVRAFVKIGCTSDFFKRLGNYECHNPQFELLDKKNVNKDAFQREKKYNKLFNNTVKGLFTHKTTEWHEVSLDTYRELQAKGFKGLKIK